MSETINNAECNSSSYWAGDEANKIVLMFSCPGRFEDNENKPVQGTTGKNLDAVLEILHDKSPTLFPTSDRYFYRIINSSDEIHYKLKDNKTESKNSTIVNSRNIQRIEQSINNKIMIIAFGEKAKLALSKCHLNCIQIDSCHLSNNNLNRNKDFKGMTQLQKFEKIAKNIYNQIKTHKAEILERIEE